MRTVGLYDCKVLEGTFSFGGKLAIRHATIQDGRHFGKRQQSSSNPMIVARASTYQTELTEKHRGYSVGVICMVAIHWDKFVNEKNGEKQYDR